MGDGNAVTRSRQEMPLIMHAQTTCLPSPYHSVALGSKSKEATRLCSGPGGEHAVHDCVAVTIVSAGQVHRVGTCPQAGVPVVGADLVKRFPHLLFIVTQSHRLRCIKRTEEGKWGKKGGGVVWLLKVRYHHAPHLPHTHDVSDHDGSQTVQRSHGHAVAVHREPRRQCLVLHRRVDLGCHPGHASPTNTSLERGERGRGEGAIKTEPRPVLADPSFFNRNPTTSSQNDHKLTCVPSAAARSER